MAFATDAGNPYGNPANISTGGVTSPAPPPTLTTTPYSTPIPGVTNYLGADLLAKRAYENALARLTYQRSGLLRSAGYLGNIDSSTGAIKNLRVDPRNPYGGYQQMLRSANQQDQAAQYGLQDRGIRGGLANQTRTELQYQHGAQATQFGTNLQNSIADLQFQQQDAGNTYASAMWQAQQAALQAALAANAFNPVLTNEQPQTPVIADQLNIPDTVFTRAPARAPASAPARYYTYRANVPLRPGQTVHYTPGRGYYAA